LFEDSGSLPPQQPTELVPQKLAKPVLQKDANQHKEVGQVQKKSEPVEPVMGEVNYYFF
jgi:hypothetical protein